jgi:hypothetical protein
LVTFDQLKLETKCPQAAALPIPCNDTFWPAATLAGTATAAMGRKAALTAPGAFAIPAPHVEVVQAHSACCRSEELAGM